MVHTYMVMDAERLGLRSVGKGDGGEELDVDERELKLYLANTMEEDGVKEEVWEEYIKYICHDILAIALFFAQPVVLINF